MVVSDHPKNLTTDINEVTVTLKFLESTYEVSFPDFNSASEQANQRFTKLEIFKSHFTLTVQKNQKCDTFYQEVYNQVSTDELLARYQEL